MSDYSFTGSPPRAAPAVTIDSTSPDSNMTTDDSSIQHVDVEEVTYIPSSSSSPTGAAAENTSGPRVAVGSQQHSQQSTAGAAIDDYDGKTPDKIENPKRSGTDSSRSPSPRRIAAVVSGERDGASPRPSTRTQGDVCLAGGTESSGTSTKVFDRRIAVELSPKDPSGNGDAEGGGLLGRLAPGGSPKDEAGPAKDDIAGSSSKEERN